MASRWPGWPGGWQCKPSQGRPNASTCSRGSRTAAFRGGALMRTPALVLGTMYYKLRDWL
jgi:hypothetical protein